MSKFSPFASGIRFPDQSTSRVTASQNKTRETPCVVALYLPLVSIAQSFLTEDESHRIYPSNQVNGVVVEWSQKVSDTVCESLDRVRTQGMHTLAGHKHTELVCAAVSKGVIWFSVRV